VKWKIIIKHKEKGIEDCEWECYTWIECLGFIEGFLQNSKLEVSEVIMKCR